MTPPMAPAATRRLRGLYETMLLIRTVETTLARVFAAGEVPGFIHLSIGQEGVAAGVASAMQPGDTLATTHRGHGHVLARGLDLEAFFKEIMGRAGGVCKGRGGSMHVSDMRLGIIGANGIVGAGIPISLGSALAFKTRGVDSVAVAMFGDGAMAEGVLHESLNMAALLKLPLLLVCENNGWSEFSRTDQQFAGALGKVAGAFGVSHVEVDGNDALAVAQATQDLMTQLRRGEGPLVLECRTHRGRGHFEGDSQQYRPAADQKVIEASDPLTLTEAALRAAGLGQQEIAAMQSAAEAAVSAALTAARQDALPDYDSALGDVYTKVGT